MEGIKETQEALIAVDEIALLLVSRFKDGVGIDDFAAVWAKLSTDQELMDKMKAGWENVNRVPAEVADIDLGEAVGLVMTEIAYVPKFIAAISG
jgi:hypothetical protein